MDNLRVFGLLQDMLQGMFAAIPKFVGAFLILVLGWIIAKIISNVIKNLIKRSPLELLSDKLKEIELFQKVDFELSIARFLSKIVYYFVFLIFIVAATDILGIQAVSQLVSDIIHYIPRLISAVFLTLIGVLLADFVKGIIKTTCDSVGIPNAGLLSSLGFYFIFIIIIITALGQAGVNTDFINSNILVIVGGVVLAFAFGYGLASKDFVANMIASMYIRKKLQVGDVIKIQNITGKIIEMDSSTCVIESGEKRIMMPLSKLTSEMVEISSHPNL
jgi:small-conductance mechanosensitive channel